jgi:glycyl-tRNA synthetase
MQFKRGAISMKNSEKTMEKIVTLCKGRGFVFSGSEIYGGLANTWDYGPLGVELKNNVKKAWWKKFVQENPYNVGLDAAILMNPQVWVASGHVATFNDPLIDCKACKMRHRADKLIEDYHFANAITDVVVEAMDNEQMVAYIREKGIVCPGCGKCEFTEIRKFNLMFKTHQGVTEDSSTEIYLRPETAQGIFVNFQNVQRTTRRKLPFGVCQVGKSFRNEITPGNFTFRTREFEQMELEFFCKPGTELEWFSYWKQFCHQWLLNLRMRPENIRLRDHEKEELSHYSNATTDFEFAFPFGWGELWGVASRTNFDLTAHQTTSGKDMTYYDQQINEHFVPYVVEPSLGADRVTLAFLVDAYDEQVVGQNKNGKDDVRVVLHLHPALAPYKCAILPLSKKEVLCGPAQQLHQQLSKFFMVDYDDAGSIGKRYRRQDEIGTPYCITVDFTTVGDENTPADNAVTIRDRDTMQQERVPIDQVKAWLEQRLAY